MNILGTEYGWAHVSVIIPGKTVPVEGVTKIEYGEKQDKKNIYARGNKPYARGVGNIEPNGSISLLLSEFNLLVQSIAGESPVAIAPFTLVVTYGNDPTLPFKTDKLIYTEFVDWKKALKQGDTSMEIDMPLVIGDIKLSKN